MNEFKSLYTPPHTHTHTHKICASNNETYIFLVEHIYGVLNQIFPLLIVFHGILEKFSLLKISTRYKYQWFQMLFKNATFTA